ncbi:uncharacterized protein LOC130933232 [Arachis stenosperma]|uniref:uncharacterized protein LOC130933232 n=1 Tax=Arachis stenosperma TaxID=217475 RepID=UPI0025AB806F|nr:uncharacterized protein LOC130933232 [Arachis stenosperma]
MTMALVIHSSEMFIAPKFPCNPNPNPIKLHSFKPVAVGSSARGLKAFCQVKDCAVLELEQNLRLYGEFSGAVKLGRKEEEEEKQKYYVNMGYAIRTLREDFPQIFFKEPSFDVYRDDIVFKDPLNTFVGIQKYKSLLWALRFHGRIFFRALSIDVINVWQPVENVIMVRWSVHGILRIPWESRGRFDGTSEYKLDRKGKIYEHRVDNIAPNTPHHKFGVLRVEELIQSIGCPSTPKPTYFETSSSTNRT